MWGSVSITYRLKGFTCTTHAIPTFGLVLGVGFFRYPALVSFLFRPLLVQLRRLVEGPVAKKSSVTLVHNIQTVGYPRPNPWRSAEEVRAFF